MKIEINGIDVSLLFQRARAGFLNCINLSENGYLEDELAVPIRNVELRDNDIRIILSSKTSELYQLEIGVKLIFEEKELGDYIYILDENDQAVDDKLIFYS
ncbi:hypothetical protein [Paraflavitalea pollutisoli]|uniref:hypothetical protein n=1 Tax=Paraflavitalea pollutisoli TaxID=3034143 RepID=UPI0023EBFC3F|nr:hypothetical protein [Paraflavitalea sp. H1-2-19X]